MRLTIMVAEKRDVCPGWADQRPSFDVRHAVDSSSGCSPPGEFDGIPTLACADASVQTDRITIGKGGENT